MEKITRMAGGMVILAVLILGFPLSTLGATGVAQLGPPANVLPGNFPLGAFRHSIIDLRQGGKPQVLFISSLMTNDDRSAAERWGVVMALDQFGTLSHVSVAPRDCVPWPKGKVCTIGSFDLHAAHYSSPYIAFRERDIARDPHTPFQHLTPTEQRLFDRYARARYATASQTLWFSVTGDHFPLLAVGPYVQPGISTIVPSDFRSTTPIPTVYGGFGNSGLSVDDIRRGLQRGYSQRGPAFVYEINAEANLISALICHTDGMRPARVCARPGVRAVLRYVR